MYRTVLSRRSIVGYSFHFTGRTMICQYAGDPISHFDGWEGFTAISSKTGHAVVNTGLMDVSVRS